MSEGRPPDPQAAAVIAKARRLMLTIMVATFVAIGIVFAIIGYRVFRAGESPPAASDITAALPAGAKVLGTAIGDGRLAVTVDIGGRTEIRLYDLKTLAPAGVLRAAP